jgi:hypothetical protein
VVAVVGWVGRGDVCEQAGAALNAALCSWGLPVVDLNAGGVLVSRLRLRVGRLCRDCR